MNLIPKTKCIENIEYFTTGKGKNNPAFTCLANSRKHLQHHEMIAKWKAIRKNNDVTANEFRPIYQYMVKNNLLSESHFFMRYNVFS